LLYESTLITELNLSILIYIKELLKAKLRYAINELHIWRRIMKFREKLNNIKNDDYKKTDFIIADAKDADMAFGCMTPGVSPSGMAYPVKRYRDDIEKVIQSRLADIMLMSVSNAEILKDTNLFLNSDVSPAVRLNDTSDIWHVRGGIYPQKAMRNFRSARLDRAREVADIGLYSVTFYNDLDQDIRTLEEYATFRDEASALGLDHFLEIFNPQISVETNSDFWAYNNDMIVRCLAGVSRRERPQFLKAAYNGPKATEELASYDPNNLIFGILGGSAGTTRDCLELIKQAEKYGARVALFGRKLYYSESSTLMLTAMRRVIESGITSEEAVKAYHSDLKSSNLLPQRDLESDLIISEKILKDNI
jgi:DhnA family fructose-bisphosphate aldolase class Ia